jgi:hypothetical protein
VPHQLNCGLTLRRDPHPGEEFGMPGNLPASSLALLMLIGLTGATRAQLAVSANDGKAELRGGVLGASANPVPDSV